jgi:copper homeostasis protein
MNLEICCYDIADAIAVQQLGIQRIELCASAQEGGTTPPQPWLAIAAEKLTMPWHCMVRPRGGNFCYSPTEVEAMLSAIYHCNQAGASGIVVGVLNRGHGIHWQQLSQLITAAGPMAITFHKAIDVVVRKTATLQKLGSMGVQYLLTTGGKTHIQQGLHQLQQWLPHTQPVQLIACGGVRSQHIPLLKNNGFQWAHAAPLLKGTNRLDLREVEKMVTSIHQGSR